MANTGDHFTVELGNTHLGWGTHRYTDSRELIPRETYIKIPSFYSREFNIFNSNYTRHQDILGQNIFKCTSDDGTFQCILKASGCSTAGSIYAKNLHVSGNLKGLTPWFDSWNAQPGDSVTLTWTSPYEIVLSHS